jgi:hypothetical protein
MQKANGILISVVTARRYLANVSIIFHTWGHVVAKLVKALSYKPEGGGFESL